MTRGRAAFVLAVLVAVVVACGPVAAQAKPMHSGSVSPISGPPGTLIIVNSLHTGSPYVVKKKGEKGDQCPSRQVRLRLVHGSTVITETRPFPVMGADAKNPGAWKGTLVVPPLAAAVPDTVQASCDHFRNGSDYTFHVFTVTNGLAHTGFAAWPWTLLGAALLTVGAALLGAGRRRAASGSA
jgi:hypothetical protein